MIAKASRPNKYRTNDVICYDLAILGVKKNGVNLGFDKSSIVEAIGLSCPVTFSDMQVGKWAEVVAKSFAAELIKLRKARGISMNELSVRTGLARSFITYMEKGERIPSLETLARIGYALGVSPGELVKRTEEAAGPVPRFRKLI